MSWLLRQRAPVPSLRLEVIPSTLGSLRIGFQMLVVPEVNILALDSGISLLRILIHFLCSFLLLSFGSVNLVGF